MQKPNEDSNSPEFKKRQIRRTIIMLVLAGFGVILMFVCLGVGLN